MRPPDVLGWLWEEAAPALLEAGVPFDLERWVPESVRRGVSGPLRVIAVRAAESGDRWRIVVAPAWQEAPD